MQETEKGCIARVLRGRGEGRYVMILELCGDDRVAIADGRALRAEKPKIKNRKHLRVLTAPIALGEDGELPSNRRLRQMIREAEQGIIEQEGLLCQRMM